ncbi:MAG: 16S rRNA (cytosine(1402)-N(4))-methyltransferase RsmH [Candidatus Saccharimonadales bacterium]
MSIKEHPPQLHVPVLLDAMLRSMRPQLNETYLDLTAGYGGHAHAFLERTARYEGSFLVDRDAFAHEHLQDLADKGVQTLKLDFLTAAQQLVKEKQTFDLIVVDLGVSSPQLDRAERGFSFSKNGPLDMRMDQSQEESAATLINYFSESELVDIIVRYGEEPKLVARRIVQAIIAQRQTKPFETTEELAETIAASYRGRRGKIHPATRTFQALRIAVNDELGQIERLLPLVPTLLNKGGRIGIISFHSLEDRLVKRNFQEQMASGYEAELKVLTKKPLRGDIDDVHNPRSRSAKLRIAVKK